MSHGPEKTDPGASAEPRLAKEQPPAEGAAQEPPTAAPSGPAEAEAEAVAAEPPAAEPESTGTKAKEPAAAERRKARFPALVRAHRAGRAIEGKIAQVIKGGYEVRLGRARAFCPHSQIDLHREDEPERQIGKSYLFRITQLRRGGEDIVVSRRAVLEEEQAEEAKSVRATLIEGAVMQGHVAGAAPFGAFIDLGAGVLGLAHISELSHQRVQTVEDAVKIGDTVNVRILKLKESGRISLSIRRAQKAPWAEIDKRFEVGKVYPGTVQRLADFGAFVELAPAIEALAPASEFPPTAGGWNAGLEVGQELQWHVLSVDAKARRLSVTLPGEPAAGEVTLVEGAELTGQVQRIERYGVFVWLRPGRVGLMPRAMTGASEGADLRREFQIGNSLEVSVVQIEEGGRRIRLRKKGVDPAPEPEAAPPPAKTRPEPEEEPQTFGTSLADKLRAALGQTDPGS